MAIEEQTARTVFKGDGSTRAFPVTWYLDAEENIIVKMTNVTTAQVKTLELGTDYTVTPSDGEYPTNGAVINYPKNSVTPALGSDYRLTVIRNVPYTQNFVFPNNTRLLPKNIEGGLDGLELQIQQINDKADNAVSIPAGMDYDNEEFVAELFDKAKSAEQSAINAKASEANAKSSATNASQSAQTATTKAQEAKASATSASQSAQTATTKAQEAISSATSAKKSETNAKASATNAKTSEDKAQEYAERAENASSSVGNPVSNVTVDNNIITVTKGVGGSAYYTVDNVDNATHATTAGTADNATHATTAGTADSATKATQDVNGNPIVFHYLSRNQSSQNDMNACTVEGIYRFNGTIKNGWTSDSWGTLLVFNNRYNGGSGVRGTYLVQIALPTDGRMWTRQRVNTGAWTSWNKLANTTDGTDTLKIVYPVGSIYMSTVSTNPATLFGFGTWEAMPAGSINTAGEHTHSLTLTALWGDGDGRGNGWAGDTLDGGSRTNTFSAVGNHTHTVTINSTGSGQPHNNLQPYISVYMWKRTA